MITDLALPKPRAPFELGICGRSLLPCKELREIQAGNPERAGAQQFAAGGSFTCVASYGQE